MDRPVQTYEVIVRKSGCKTVEVTYASTDAEAQAFVAKKYASHIRGGHRVTVTRIPEGVGFTEVMRRVAYGPNFAPAC